MMQIKQNQLSFGVVMVNGATLKNLTPEAQRRFQTALKIKGKEIFQAAKNDAVMISGTKGDNLIIQSIPLKAEGLGQKFINKINDFKKNVKDFLLHKPSFARVVPMHRGKDGAWDFSSSSLLKDVQKTVKASDKELKHKLHIKPNQDFFMA